MNVREVCYLKSWGAYFHGSTFGQCEHSQVLALMGGQRAPFAESNMKIFAAGHNSEAVVKGKMTDAGFVIQYGETDLDQQHKVSIEGNYVANNGKPFCVAVHSHLDGCVTKIGDFKKAGFCFAPRHAVENYRKDPEPEESYNVYYLLENKSASTNVFKGYLDILKKAEKSTYEFSEELDDLDVYSHINTCLCNYYCDNNRQYAYQISANYAGLKNQKTAESPKDICGGIIVTVHCRDNKEDEIDESTGEVVKPGSPYGGMMIAFHFYTPPFTERQCLDRCANIYINYVDDIIPVCDNKWPCGYSQCSLEQAAIRLNLKKNRDSASELRAAQEELDKEIQADLIKQFAGFKVKLAELPTNFQQVYKSNKLVNQ